MNFFPAFERAAGLIIDRHHIHISLVSLRSSQNSLEKSWSLKVSSESVQSIAQHLKRKIKGAPLLLIPHKGLEIPHFHTFEPKNPVKTNALGTFQSTTQTRHYVQGLRQNQILTEPFNIGGKFNEINFYRNLQNHGIRCPGLISRTAIWHHFISRHINRNKKCIVLCMTDKSGFCFVFQHSKILGFRHFFHTSSTQSQQIKHTMYYLENKLNLDTTLFDFKIIDFRKRYKIELNLRNASIFSASMLQIPSADSFDSLEQFYTWGGAFTFLDSRYKYIKKSNFAEFQPDYIPTFRTILTLASAVVLILIHTGNLYFQNSNFSQIIDAMKTENHQKNLQEKELRYVSKHLGPFISNAIQGNEISNFLNQIGIYFNQNNFHFISLDFNNDHLLIEGNAPSYGVIPILKSSFEASYKTMIIEIIKSEREPDGRIHFTLSFKAKS